MASTPNINLKTSVSPKVLQRAVLLGRVKMAQAIQMKEPEWAKLLSDVEKDPLVQELFGASAGGKGIIRYRRFPRAEFSGQFYEEQDVQVPGGSGGELPEALLEKRKHLLPIIQRIGSEKFETYFLYREKAEPPERIAAECGLSVGDVNEIQDFILDMSVQAEFLHPSKLAGEGGVRPTLVGKIVRNDDGTFSVSFFSPHLARGQYEINHEALKKWQSRKNLGRTDAARIRKLVGLLELSNMKQGAFWRVIDYLLVLQKEYFETRDEARMAPASLRKVARHLQFAPSTISRVIGNKSILLPWDREALILDLMPGQRAVVLSILDKFLATDAVELTDAQLAGKVEKDFGIRVSRRTITACRHALAPSRAKAA